jgi:hypothetical protein
MADFRMLALVADVTFRWKCDRDVGRQDIAVPSSMFGGVRRLSPSREDPPPEALRLLDLKRWSGRPA